MKVRRHVNAYGYYDTPQLKYIEQGYTNSIMIRTTGSVMGNRCARLQPVNGLKVSGWKMPTVWGTYAHRTSYSSFDFTYPWVGKTYRVRGDAPLGMPLPLPHPNVITTSTSVKVLTSSSLNNQAYAEARLKLKESDFNAGVALAESKRTLDLLSVSVITLLRAIAYAMNGHWSKAGAVIGIPGWKDVPRTYTTSGGRTTRNPVRFNSRAFAAATANRWLEYQYGWKPLFSDLYALQQNLKDGFRSNDQTFRIVRQIKRGLPKEQVLGLDTAYYEKTLMEGVHEEIIKVVYFQKLGNAHLNTISEYGLTNPALIAWELVPFSFVLDWLLPIGTFLESLTVASPFNFTAGYSDHIIHWDLKVELDVRVGTSTGTKPAYTYKGFAFERRVHKAWALPMPYMKSPFSSTHILNAIALMISTRRWAAR